MRGENGVPPTPEWTPPEPHAWDAERCCPPECVTVGEVHTALARLDGTEASALSLMTGLSIAEIDELGGLGEN